MVFYQNWTNSSGNHEGGVSYGEGFCISWQRGPLNETGRNGAFLIEVLEACYQQLEYFQNSKFACAENEQALGHLRVTIQLMENRRKNRQVEGTLGTSQVGSPTAQEQ